mgnify:CR=1 FL=1
MIQDIIKNFDPTRNGSTDILIPSPYEQIYLLINIILFLETIKTIISKVYKQILNLT